MNAERLLVLYDRVADAPDAVARLRRFVLDLAVRGKLVEQDPEDEPLPLVDETVPTDCKVHFDIPLGWKWSRLRSLGVLKGGGTPSKARDDFWIGDTPWVSPKDMKVDYVDTAQLSISDAAIAESTVKLIESESILFVVRGMILAHSFPVAVSKVPLTINQDMKALVLHRPETAEYVLRALKGLTPEMLARVQRSSHGTCRIESTHYADFLIPLPPLAEQRRILARVEELMTLLDRLEAARDAREAARDRLTAASLVRLTASDTAAEDVSAHSRFALDALPVLAADPDQIKLLRQTILSLAVRGKLVEQDPTDEPVLELLERITAERTQLINAGEVGKQKPTLPLEQQEAPFSLPSGWIWSRFGAIVLNSDSGWSPRAESHVREGDAWGVLKVSAVSWGNFDPGANKQVLPGTEPRLQAQVHKGDFLISRANTAELVARAVIVHEEPKNLMMSDKIVRLRLATACSHRFAWLVNNYSDYAREYYAASATGVSPSMKNVSRAAILNLPIPFPPLAEQHRILAKVDALMALCDRLESALRKTDTTRARLLDALIHEALSPTAPAVHETAA